MLLGSFYKIVDAQPMADGYRVQIQIADEHPIFDGHFPQGPVVPGVCQLQMLEEVLTNQTGKNVQLSKAGMVKFLVGIEPVKHRDITMDIHVQQTDAVYSVNATYYNPQEVFFKFKGDLHAC